MNKQLAGGRGPSARYKSSPDKDQSWFALRLAGLISGCLGLLGLGLPLLQINVEAFGFEVARMTMTIWNLADIAEVAGEAPSGIYLLTGVIAIGSIIDIVGVGRSVVLEYVGSIIQVGGIGYLVYNLWFGSVGFIGVEAIVTPEIGVFVLTIAAFCGLATFLL